MGFDIRTLGSQVDAMVSHLVEQSPRTLERRRQARNAYAQAAGRWQQAARTVEESTMSFVAAVPYEDPSRSYAPRQLPADYLIVATDGSQIEPERHDLALYLLINVGWALLRYGSHAVAQLGSEPTLRFRDEELEYHVNGRRIPIREELLATLRSLFERKKLADLLLTLDGTHPALGLVDGSLLDLTLSNRRQELPPTLIQELLSHFDRVRDGGCLLASYISCPASREVANFARWALCSDLPKMACRDCSSQRLRGVPDCHPLDSQIDTALLPALPPYHRSALFSPLQRLQERYGQHRISCFYLNAGPELARIEVPLWVAQDPDRLALTHSIIADQCRRGGYRGARPGYPPALIEAHEQAVVTIQDRQVLEMLLERRSAQQGLVLQRSAKAISKHMKAV
ncbi:MAG: DNA double-strand break repair nuclease NurA [Chloroflexi bacterium]|nr:DNA double-strand break repair nuclease NurA [Chloroflexota bacterium]